MGAFEGTASVGGKTVAIGFGWILTVGARVGGDRVVGGDDSIAIVAVEGCDVVEDTYVYSVG